MYYKPYFIILCLFLVCNQGFTQSAEKTTKSLELFNEKALLQNIKTLSSDAFEGRRTDTKGGAMARQFIINQFNSHDVLPLKKTFEQTFSFNNRKKSYQGTNILGYIKGTETSDRYIVISAHYDHEGIKNGLIYNGADDDASGIAALISFAEYFKNNPPKHSVILAAFDAEELGLEGSKYFVNNSVIPLKSIMVNLNMDMISRSEKNELFAVGARYNETLTEVISNFKAPHSVTLRFGHDGADNLENWTYSSDHSSFHNKEIPFLYFGVDDHEDYHTPNDDYENIQPEFYKESVKIILLVFNTIDTLNF